MDVNSAEHLFKNYKLSGDQSIVKMLIVNMIHQFDLSIPDSHR